MARCEELSYPPTAYRLPSEKESVIVMLNGVNWAALLATTSGESETCKISDYRSCLAK